jgi:hypothetical protein
MLVTLRRFPCSISSYHIRSMSSIPNLDTTDIKTAPGVTLDAHQTTLVASVLDVHFTFAGSDE